MLPPLLLLLLFLVLLLLLLSLLLPFFLLLLLQVFLLLMLLLFLWLFHYRPTLKYVFSPQLRAESLRDACLCCWKKPDWKPDECSQRSLLTSAFRAYAGALMKLPCRLAALFVTAVLLGVSIWGVTQLEAEFDENLFVNPDTYLRNFLEEKDDKFPSNGMVGSVYVVGVEVRF